MVLLLSQHRAAALLSLSVLITSGCAVPPTQIDGYDEYAEGCDTNSPPAIANIEVNSVPDDQEGFEGGYLLSFHFDWRDPNPPDDSQAQNMVGGYMSINMQGWEFNSRWIDEDLLLNGCAASSFELFCQPLGYTPGSVGCSASAAADCTTGQITWPIRGGDSLLAEGSEILFEMRVRDRCGAVSSEKNNYEAGAYVIGSGLFELPDAGDETPDEDSAE